MIRAAGGLVVLAHVDRPSYSVISQLGFLPGDLFFHAAELTDIDKIAQIRPLFPEDTVWLANSDAHFPVDIGKRYTKIEIEELSFDGLVDAIEDGRVEGVF